MTQTNVTDLPRSGDITPDAWPGPEQDPPGPGRPGWPPTPTDRVWQDPRTVWRIAAGPQVDLAAHDLAHPQPVHGCPWCPQSGMCPRCLLPSPECPDPAACLRVLAAGESTLRAA